MIYVRSHNTVSDQEFLKILGLKNYNKAFPPLDRNGKHAVFANDAE